MNHQPTNTYPDTAIDQVLDALRTTEPPTGLEQRIAARLAQAAEARSLKTEDRTTTPPFFAVILTLSRSKGKAPRILLAPAKLYIAAALTIVIAVTTFTLLHTRTSADTNGPTYAQSRVPHLRDGIIVAKVGIAPSATASPSVEAASLQSRHTAPATNPSLAPDGISHPPSPSAQDPSAQDPDAIALAETLAPSRPGPPMPPTAQEQLILSATRPGQPLQLAELDLARAPILRAAAEAREQVSLDRYVKSLLAPFAAADALSPATDSQPQETSTPPPPPSPSNAN